MLDTPTMPTLSLKRWRHVRPRLALALLIATLLLLLAPPMLGMPQARAAHMRATGAAPAYDSRALPLPRLLDPTPLSTAGQPLTLAAAPQSSAPPGNFPFKTVQSPDGMLVIHYYNRPESAARGYIDAARQALQHPIHDTLGFSLTHRVDIYIYGSRQDFLAGAPVTNAAETSALADSLHNTIYLTSARQGDEGMINVLPHELTHIVFHQNQDIGHLESLYFTFYPIWLDEGLAAYDEPLNSPFTRAYDDALAKAVADRHPVDILQQFASDYPPDPDTDYLAYAESRSFISYLIATYGRDTFHAFLVDAREGQLLLDAQQHFGVDLRVLESRWEVSQGFPPTVPDQGFSPVSPIPIAMGSSIPLPSLALRTRPFYVAEPLNASLPWLAFLAAIFVLAVEQLLQAWLHTRRRSRRSRDTASQPTDPLLFPSSQQPNAPDQAQPAPLSTPAGGASAIPVLAPASPASITPLVRRDPRWFDVALILLPLPLALAAAWLALQVDASQSWHRAYLVAGIVTVPFILIYLPLLWRGRLSGHLPTYRIIGAGLAVMLLVTALAQATIIGKTQAHAYELRGAYALALSTYADAGGRASDTAADLERVHIELSQAALEAGDYPLAVAQVRALFTLDPATLSIGEAYYAFTSAVLELGTSLLYAHQFDQAQRLYADVRAFGACASECHTLLDQKLAEGYLLWAGALQNQGNFAASLEKLTLVTQKYARTPSAAIAQRGIPEVEAQQILSAALAAGANGDYATMNAQLRSLATTYPHTAAATQAPEVPQPVTGVVRDSVTNASVAGDRLYFIAFATQADARSFDFNFDSHKVAFVTGATLGNGGAFTARLQPGYWYVPFWDDPSQASAHFFNAPLLGSGNDAFAVTSFTPANAGVITGY